MIDLEFKQVNFSFGPVRVLQDISFALNKGDLACLIGLSGSGKTTLLRLAAGFSEPDSGEIYLRQQLVTGEQYRSCRERRVGFVFQDYALFNHLSVKENIEYGCQTAKHMARADELVENLGLRDHLSKYPPQLSGGEKQRVALARSLALEPDVLLLDEPFSGIDRQKTQKLVKELRGLFKKLKVTALMITHSLDEAIHFADQILFLNQGEILQQGKIQDFYERPKSQAVRDFFGQALWLEGEVRAGEFHCQHGHWPLSEALPDGPYRALLPSGPTHFLPKHPG